MKYENIMELVIGYIITLDINDLANLKLSEIASYFGLNRGYLSKKFNENAPMTIMKFIQLEKIKRGETLLKTRHDLSVEAISSLLGITDVRRFRKFFKATFGLKPGLYRTFYKEGLPKKQRTLSNQIQKGDDWD